MKGNERTKGKDSGSTSRKVKKIPDYTKYGMVPLFSFSLKIFLVISMLFDKMLYLLLIQVECGIMLYLQDRYVI